MEYYGKLYGKIGKKYFDTSKTGLDFDLLTSEIKRLNDEITKFNEWHNSMIIKSEDKIEPPSK